MVSFLGGSPFGNGIQIDGTINSGMSGDPLIDVKTGLVVGIAKSKVGTLTPHLKGIKEGTTPMNADLQHSATDVTNLEATKSTNAIFYGHDFFFFPSRASEFHNFGGVLGRE
jgi:hypothetical protein